MGLALALTGKTADPFTRRCFLRESDPGRRAGPAAVVTRVCQSLLFQAKTEFFNYRIGQHFPRDPFHLCLRCLGIQRIFQRDLKVFSLPDVTDAPVLHLL